MKLLFINCSAMRFHAGTPEREPLGGTESATAYLARHLAILGHDVTLMSPLPDNTPDRMLAVRHVPFARLASNGDFFAREKFDAIVAPSAPAAALHLKRMAPDALQVSWLHQMPGVPSMLPLPQMTPWIDCAVFVSAWQRAQFDFEGPAQVIGNGIAPAFENMFGSAAALHAAKENRAVYTSQPDRGLDVLADAILLARVGTQLDVYSGTRTYQEKNDPFTPIYQKIAGTPRCHYHGPVSQAALAQSLKRAAFLAYPCTYLETYCIGAQEAIAAGLKVIATDLGALRDTTLGYADLVPLGLSAAALVPVFAAGLEKAEADFVARPEAWADERFAQSQTINRQCSWAVRAREWEDFLAPAIAWRRG